MTDEDRMSANKAGRLAAENNIGCDQCPFVRGDEWELRQAWICGWIAMDEYKKTINSLGLLA